MSVVRIERIISVNSKEIQPPYYLNDTHLSLHGEIIGIVINKKKISASKGSIYTIRETKNDHLFDIYSEESKFNNRDALDDSITKPTGSLNLGVAKGDMLNMVLSEINKLSEDDLGLIYDMLKRLNKG